MKWNDNWEKEYPPTMKSTNTAENLYDDHNTKFISVTIRKTFVWYSYYVCYARIVSHFLIVSPLFLHVLLLEVGSWQSELSFGYWCIHRILATTRIKWNNIHSQNIIIILFVCPFYVFRLKHFLDRWYSFHMHAKISLWFSFCLYSMRYG